MPAITIREITKTYRLGVGRARIREMTPWPMDQLLRKMFPKWWGRDTFNALEDVSLTIPSGSTVGIVGHNGAGKTTLLKVIAGVTAPSTGTVMATGRMAALIDVIIGFHPEMTGVENAYLLGAIHGFGRRSMAPRLDRIFEFAEIADLGDTPLKRYSSGMIARLGFSVITALDMDILLVDEVLAVGDAAFQRKCLQWLDQFRQAGGTLLFVSHNLSLVRNMTERAVWLNKGKVIDDGPTHAVLGRYAKAMSQRSHGDTDHRAWDAARLAATRGSYRWGAGGARVEEVHMSEPSERTPQLEVEIRYEAEALESGIFCLGFVDEAGREIGAAASPPRALENGKGGVHCTIRPLPLRPGIYFPVVAILSPDGLVRDRWRLDRALVIDGDGEVGMDDFGPIDIPAAWS
jgi:ABC-type polysaccharide/polyol phosphate transport system ATPase subunit